MENGIALFNYKEIKFKTWNSHEIKSVLIPDTLSELPELEEFIVKSMESHEITQLFLENQQTQLEDVDKNLKLKIYLPLLNEKHFSHFDKNLLRDHIKNITFKNNLHSLTHLFNILKVLRSFWESNTREFIKELREIITINLGTQEIHIIFNEAMDEENKKLKNNKIQKAMFGGAPFGTFSELNQMAKNLCQDISKTLENYCEFDESEDLNSLRITAHVNQSPLIIVCKNFQANDLQKIFLFNLFRGLQSNPF